MTLSLISYPPPLIMAQAPVTIVVETDETTSPLRIAAGVTGSTDADSMQVDSNSQATFELSDYLQGLITARGFLATVPQQYTNNPKLVTFDFVEWSGSPPVDTYDLQEQGPYYLIDGAIPKQRRQALYTQHSNLIAYLIYTKSCLSWWPDEAKRILPTQKEFINFLQLYDANAITITLSATLTFTDGTTGASGTLFTVNGVDYMNLIYFPTGYADLGLAAIMASTYPTKTLAGYTVVVKTGSTVISKAYSYTLDTNYYQHARTLWIRNAFGLWEVLLCTGLGAQENEIKPQTAVTDGKTLPDKIAWRTDRTEVVKVNTGYLTNAQMQWLSELDYREAYEMISGVLHPLVFRDLTIRTDTDAEFQYSAELEYEYAYTEVTEAAT